MDSAVRSPSCLADAAAAAAAANTIEGCVTTSSSRTGVGPTPVQLALRAAADRVARSSVMLHRELIDDPAQYVDAIVALLTGPPVRIASETSPRFVHWLTREDVDELRADFLRDLDHSSGDVDSTELLRVLVALERLGDRQERTVEQSLSQLDDADPVTAVTEVAHDMRSPLTSILFLIDSILKGQSGPLTAVQERQLKLVYSAAWGLSTLACDVIDAVRGHRLLDGRPTPFSITESIQNVCEIVRPIAEEKRLAIHTTMPMEDGRLGYSSALARVLLNLASNALRYTDEGSVSIGCTELDHQRVVFWVEDTGRGLAADGDGAARHSQRRSSSGPYYSSTGLGLAICRNLLNAMGSRLFSETVASGGTKFSFEIDLPPA